MSQNKITRRDLIKVFGASAVAATGLFGMSAMILYHCSGISFSLSKIFRSIITSFKSNWVKKKAHRERWALYDIDNNS